MYIGFKQLYYIKNLHFDAGRTVVDYIYSKHINLTDRTALNCLGRKVNYSNKNLYFFKDLSGRRFSLLCREIAEINRFSDDIFLFKDDCSAQNKWLALYAAKSKKFIYLSGYGCCMDKYYYRKNGISYSDKALLQRSKTYFEKSEYIAKNRGLWYDFCIVIN